MHYELCIKFLPIRSESEEVMLFQPSVGAALLWNEVCVHVVAWNFCHFVVFFHCSASSGGFKCFVSLYDFRHELRILHDDATTCGLGYLMAHACKELRVGVELRHVAGIGIEEVGGHLDGWTKFECSRGRHMMAHACCAWTDGLTFVVPIDIDEGYRGIETLVDKELTQSTYLLGCERLFGMRGFPHGTIDVVPKIGGSFTCHPLDVLTGDELVVISLADAGCHPEDESCFAAGTYASEGALIDFVALTAAVALFFQTFYADEGSDITYPTELLGNIVGEEGAIGEELEVAVAVVQEKVNESLVEKGFAS